MLISLSCWHLHSFFYLVWVPRWYAITLVWPTLNEAFSWIKVVQIIVVQTSHCMGFCHYSLHMAITPCAWSSPLSKWIKIVKNLKRTCHALRRHCLTWIVCFRLFGRIGFAMGSNPHQFVKCNVLPLVEKMVKKNRSRFPIAVLLTTLICSH